jgi:hypothetical protein
MLEKNKANANNRLDLCFIWILSLTAKDTILVRQDPAVLIAKKAGREIK